MALSAAANTETRGLNMLRLFGTAGRICVVAFLLTTLGRNASAQGRALVGAEVGALVDSVVSTLFPIESKVSRVSVAKRGISLDVPRVRRAFQLPNEDASLTTHRLSSRMAAVDSTVLSDCDASGRLKCERLRWSVFLRVEPISRSDTSIVVRVVALWPDRGSADIDNRAATLQHATLVGYSTELHFLKTETGWKFVRRANTVAGD